MEHGFLVKPGMTDLRADDFFNSLCGLLKRVGCVSDCVRRETVASLFAPAGSVIEVRLRA